MSFQNAKLSNAQFHPSYLPVIIFVGGTSGIGKCMAQSLIHILNGNARVIIVGRNRQAAEEIIASFPVITEESTNNGASYEFMACDVTLMKNVHELTKTLLEKLDKINFLVLSAGVFGLRGRDETEEGIDKKLASRYYSRWVLTNDLLPLLRKAKELKEDAKVMSILGAGMHAGIDIDDLGLKKTYTGLKAMMESTSYNDLMFAEFASRNPELSFIHIYPGFVNTPATRIHHWLETVFYPLVRFIVWIIATRPEVCAEYMLHALLSSEKGFSRRNAKAEDIGLDHNFPRVEGAQSKLWEHSAEVTKSNVL